MDKKLEYLSPEVDLIHLSTESPLLDGSVNANGADVTFGESATFESIFGA
jgi:hypothetical protein